MPVPLESQFIDYDKNNFIFVDGIRIETIPDSYEKYIVMLRSHHPRRKESLAEYYFRTDHHQLGKIIVEEYDPDCNGLRIAGNNISK